MLEERGRGAVLVGVARLYAALEHRLPRVGHFNEVANGDG
jgi:hypothetical protein